MSSSDPHLKRLYGRYNKKYFAGALPPDTRVRWSHRGDVAAAGGRNKMPHGTCEVGEPYEIVLDDFLHRHNYWLVAKSTLLHEMCHVATRNRGPQRGHGAAFKRERRRLIVAGAFDALL